MTGLTLPVTAAFAWLFTPFVSGTLVARSPRARAAVARYLWPCVAAGWLGVAALVWGATSLNSHAGVIAFVAGGPLAGLSFWGRSDGDDDGDDPPPEPEPSPPEWDWARFERELRAYARERDASRLTGVR
jgi:hypothetical protein